MDPYDISKIYNDMELDLIASMKKALAKNNTGDWQKQKLLNLKNFRAANAKIANGYKGSLGKGITGILKGSFVKGSKNTDKILGSSKLTNSITTIGGESFFKINEKRINALINSVNGDLASAGKAMLRQADDIYRQTIFKSQMNLNAGALSLNQSIDMATKDFLDKGFNCITYKDGRKVNIASYAEMALRTSSQRAVFTGEGSRRDEWGVHTVVVSSHNSCSELCLPWQGRVYIDNVYSGGDKSEGNYPLLSTAMENGLFHPNCRHNMGTYFEGINTPPEQADNQEALRNYEAEQKQRYMERQIIKYKRREVGSLDPQNVKNANDKVKAWQSNLRQHLNDNPQLRRASWREQNKTPIVNNGNNAIIKDKLVSSLVDDLKNLDVTAYTSRKALGQDILKTLGLNNINVSVKSIAPNGYCSVNFNGNSANITEYVLDSKDLRGENYKIKTAFHESYHAKADGMKTDYQTYKNKWLDIEETFAETSAHFLTKQVGITEEIAPSYSEKLVNMLPRLKQLDTFKDCKSFSDFGEIAWKERLNGVNPEWKDLHDQCMKVPHDPVDYSKKYLPYIENNKEELIDVMLKNMPAYTSYRGQMIKDCEASIVNIKAGMGVSGNQKTVFENVLAISMNRLGVE